MGRKAKQDAVETTAPEADATPARSGPRIARLFLMVAGGLAAPCLALAAFFFSGSEDPPKAAQSGRVTATTRPAGSAAAPTGGGSITTTTTAPIRSADGLRDPFAPLVK